LKLINVFFSLVLPLLGSFMLRWLIGVIGLKVFVYPEGFVRLQWKRTAVFPWNSITQIRKRSFEGTVTITRRDGLQFTYSKDTLKDAERLTRIIQDSVRLPSSLPPIDSNPSSGLTSSAPPIGSNPSLDTSLCSFEALSRRFQKVMTSANQWARDMGHDYVGTEHVLLALIEGDSGPVVDLCRQLQVQPAAIRSTIAEFMAESEANPVNLPSVPVTPMTRQVVEYAVEEARGLGHNEIREEHLFLGILWIEECVAAQVLLDLGIHLEGRGRG
jgi:hypothetical protein